MNVPHEYESLPLYSFRSSTVPDMFLPGEEERSGFKSGFAMRCFFYFSCGLALFAAFCTPLNLARELFWAGSELNWIALACVLVSTTLTGILFDGLIGARWHPILIGFLWAMTNAVVFAFLILAVSPTPLGRLLEGLMGCGALAVLFGPVYGVLCLHLSLPISALSAWGARQMGR